MKSVLESRAVLDVPRGGLPVARIRSKLGRAVLHPLHRVEVTANEGHMMLESSFAVADIQ
jgi:hypothetical protein